ncbi:MAG: translation initiation factor IF-2 [Parachlamydiales bacterium]|nr:translation initiation factor IF-2 [Parachlamydiales bacterium]
MAKDLKIKIKNTQIAEALKFTTQKKKTTATKKKLSKTDVSSIVSEESEKTSKRKVRLLPSKEEPKEKKQQAPSSQKIEESSIHEKIPLSSQETSLVEEKISSSSQEELSPKPSSSTSAEKTPQPIPLKPLAPKKGKENEKELEIETEKEIKKLKKPSIKEPKKHFDARDRMGLRVGEEEQWRKKRPYKKVKKVVKEEEIIRPKQLKIVLPITLKDLAAEMKLKASELIAKLFAQGIVVILNDFLDDETVVQLLGHEFGCEITIDTSEADKLKITSKTILEEIQQTDPSLLSSRPPVVTFMGHVDHGKTSLIDKIRQSNIAEHEAGAITQHIGAFVAKTSLGDITILDTPGHEAFSEIRSRGANVTDIVILVIAGDEGMREQTIEALQKAKEASVPIVVAINKSDKAGFDPEKVFRQLADNDLLPEAWGGTTITVNCSALSGSGINTLLEMLSLQAEVLELKANSSSRARGTILESQMHTGLGAIATVLVQNGTLKIGDAIVFGDQSGRIKTIHDQYDHPVESASPSIPVKITGLSGLAEAGSEFIVVSSEKEAKQLAQARLAGIKREEQRQKKRTSFESILEKKIPKKILPLIIRGDVQGSLEALQNSLLKIKSQKVILNIISTEVGEISESDIELAAASKAIILGFHTKVESHAEPIMKQKGVKVLIHDIIYHAIDNIKQEMVTLLDKIVEERDTGRALVKATFKSSHLGIIAGCIIEDGTIKRNNQVRILRENNIIWKGKIASIKRLKDDIKEASKGAECGILLENFSDVQQGDIIQAFDINLLEPSL